MDEEGGFLLGNMKSSLEATRLDELAADWIIFKCSAVGKYLYCINEVHVSVCPSSGSVMV
jgi:hypothetical protein